MPPSHPGHPSRRRLWSIGTTMAGNENIPNYMIDLLQMDCAAGGEEFPEGGPTIVKLPSKTVISRERFLSFQVSRVQGLPFLDHSRLSSHGCPVVQMLIKPYEAIGHTIYAVGLHAT